MLFKKEPLVIAIIVLISVMFLIIEIDVQHTLSDQKEGGTLALIELAIASVFTLDIVVRLWSAHVRDDDQGHQVAGLERHTFRHALHTRFHVPTSASGYIRSPEFIIDLLAVVPFWLSLFTPAAWFGVFRAMRVLRVLKLYRYSVTGHHLIHQMFQKMAELRVLFTVTMMVILLGAVAVYETEHQVQPDAFASIYDAIWWMVVTMTTVGYGDISPTTDIGKAVAMLMMPVSLGIMGALIGIVGGVFEGAMKVDIEVLKDGVEVDIETTVKPG
jgi:voltage-gated potassium channel Kch